MKKEKEELIPDFLQIPYQLYLDKTLKPKDRDVYGAIYFFSKMRGEKCFASNQSIAKIINSSPQMVSNSLKKLEEKQYIIRKFSDQKNKRKRTEIIPLVSMTKTSSRLRPNTATDVSKKSKRIQPQMYPNTATDVSQYSHRCINKTCDNKANFLPKSEVECGSNQNGLVQSDTSTAEEIENNIRISIENNNKEIHFDPSGNTILPVDNGNDFKPTGEVKNSPKNESEKLEVFLEPERTREQEKEINETLKLFTPFFSGDFIGSRNAYMKIPTRDAVWGLMQKYNKEQIQDLLIKYDEKKSDPYRPSAGTVYDFCTYKLAKIEAFLAKVPTGQLWAQKPISTPEQRAVSEKRIKEIADKSRKEMAAAKVAWELKHQKGQ